MQPVADFCAGSQDGAGRQFQDFCYAVAYTTEPPGAHAVAELHNLIASIESQRVDAHEHPESVDAGGRLDKKPTTGRNDSSAHETEKPGKEGVGDAYPRSQYGLICRVGDDKMLHAQTFTRFDRA